jgi:hypothetical protein
MGKRILMEKWRNKMMTQNQPHPTAKPPQISTAHVNNQKIVIISLHLGVIIANNAQNVIFYSTIAVFSLTAALLTKTVDLLYYFYYIH